MKPNVLLLDLNSCKSYKLEDGELQLAMTDHIFYLLNRNKNIIQNNILRIKILAPKGDTDKSTVLKILNDLNLELSVENIIEFIQFQFSIDITEEDIILYSQPIEIGEQILKTNYANIMLISNNLELLKIAELCQWRFIRCLNAGELRDVVSGNEPVYPVIDNGHVKVYIDIDDSLLFHDISAHLEKTILNLRLVDELKKLKKKYQTKFYFLTARYDSEAQKRLENVASTASIRKVLLEIHEIEIEEVFYTSRLINSNRIMDMWKIEKIFKQPDSNINIFFEDSVYEIQMAMKYQNDKKPLIIVRVHSEGDLLPSHIGVFNEFVQSCLLEEKQSESQPLIPVMPQSLYSKAEEKARFEINIRLMSAIYPILNLGAIYGIGSEFLNRGRQIIWYDFSHPAKSVENITYRSIDLEAKSDHKKSSVVKYIHQDLNHQSAHIVSINLFQYLNIKALTLLLFSLINNVGNGSQFLFFYVYPKNIKNVNMLRENLILSFFGSRTDCQVNGKYLHRLGNA